MATPPFLARYNATARPMCKHLLQLILAPCPQKRVPPKPIYIYRYILLQKVTLPMRIYCCTLPDTYALPHCAVSCHQVFVQLFEYLSKGSLDVVLCMTARGEMVGDRLRVVLQGDPSSNPHGLDHICPIHILNDVNLLTVLDSFKLATDVV